MREEEDEGAGIKSLNFCSKVESRCLKRFLSLFKQILEAVERVSEENLARDGCRVEIVESLWCCIIPTTSVEQNVIECLICRLVVLVKSQAGLIESN